MKRRSKEEKESLYRNWQASGMSKSDFAREHGIDRSTFYLMCKKIEDSGGLEGTSGFHPIKLSPGTGKTTPPSSAILHFPSGVVMELHGELDAGLLQTLVG